jgi:large conductance mechanosensitive channel
MHMKKVAKEFKEFISRGNVMDLAIGVIIGAAFGKIVSSLVNDVIMPVIGLILGGINFKEWAIALGTNAKGEVVNMNIGLFIQTVVDFLLVAIVIFLLVKLINSFRRKKEKEPEATPPPAEPSEEVKLLSEIRDLLKK